MKNYNSPEAELLVFASEDLLVLSDENQIAPDNLGDTLMVQDVKGVPNI